MEFLKDLNLKQFKTSEASNFYIWIVLWSVLIFPIGELLKKRDRRVRFKREELEGDSQRQGPLELDLRELEGQLRLHWRRR